MAPRRNAKNGDDPPPPFRPTVVHGSRGPCRRLRRVVAIIVINVPGRRPQFGDAFLSYALALSWLFASSLANPPPGHLNLAHAFYCMQHAEECPSKGPAVIEWSPRVDHDIREIDRAVNRSITPRNEVGDEWTIGPAFGDCDDFVVTKRHALIRIGYPPRALRPKVVSRNRPNDHLVLEVVTTKQTYVLDMRAHIATTPSEPKSARLQTLLHELATEAAR